MAVVIFTDRLELVPLPPALVESIARGDGRVAARRLDAAVPEGWTDTIPAQQRLEQLAADPSEQPWLVRAVVLRAPRRVVGNVGFHGPPDNNGRVEVGYGILASQRRQGYAREAIGGLTDWAFATGEARVCVASVSPRNGPRWRSCGRSAFGRSANRSTRSTDSSSCSSGRCR